MKSNVEQRDLSGLDDESLVQLYIGDAVRYGEAFEILVQRYQGKVFGLCVRMMGSAGDAEDQAQEVFIKVYRSLGRFEGRARFSTWLYRIAVNACLDALEKRRRRPQASDIEWTDMSEMIATGTESRSWHGSTPEAVTLHAEQVAVVHNALAELDATYREALVKRELEGLSYREMSQQAEAGLSAMKMRVHRARKALTGVLQQQMAAGII